MRRMLISFSCLIALPMVAYSCSCVPNSACIRGGGLGHPVFVGTVLSVVNLPPTGDEHPYLSSRSAKFRIDESFGGVPEDMREIEVWTGSASGDCGIGFRTGDRFLIDAFIGRDGFARAGICSGTRRLETGGTSLAILAARKAGKPLPTLTGRIAQADRNFRGRTEQRKATLLGNRLVRIQETGGGKEYETRSDAAGVYAFFGLPDGKYEFAPELPAGTELSWYVGSDEAPAAVTVAANQCREHDLEVFSSGSVQGRVLDTSGKPVRQAHVYIVPEDQEIAGVRRDGYWESPGKEGFFRFVHIPPGRYVLVVNPEQEMNPHFPYGRTFYPRGRERYDAQVVTVQAGERVEGLDIQLGEPFPTRRVTVRAKWSDGRAVDRFFSVVGHPLGNPAAVAHVESSDSDEGTARMDLHVDESYRIEAEFICQYAYPNGSGPGARLRSNTVVVRPGDGKTEITLTMAAAGCPEVEGKRRLN